MTEQKPTSNAKVDQILDLLLDALAERQAARRPAATPPVAQSVAQSSGLRPASEPAPGAQSGGLRHASEPAPVAQSSGVRPAQQPAAKPPAAEPRPGDPGWTPPARQPSIQLDRTLGRLIVLILALIVLMNIPVTRYGVSLARILPDATSIIIRDGLVLKGEGDQIYVLEDNKLRWISSLEAFDRLGYRWSEVHQVDAAFLAQFEQGAPLHILLKCAESPHIYRIEEGKKRWIKDIATFEAEGHVWEDVRLTSCAYLRTLPDGVPIPADAGTPPQP